MKTSKSRTAAITCAIAMAASVALPGAAHAGGKNCEGDARVQRFATMAYRMSGLTIFYDVMYQAAARQKFYECRF